MQVGTIPQLTGQEVCRLMRVHKKTIAGLSRSMQITQKRVRHVRERGVLGKEFVTDWLEALCAHASIFQQVPLAQANR